MERRKAFATAGAVSVTALAAVMALGANMGLFGLARSDAGPGQFKLVDNTEQTKPAVHTEVVDVPVPVADPAPAPAAARSGPSRPATPAPSTAVAPSGSSAAGGTYESGGGHEVEDGHEVEGGHEFEPGDGADD